MKLGNRVGVKMLHRCRRRHMSTQQVGLQSTHIEVSIEELELPADVADDCTKISRAYRQLAAVQASVRSDCAYRWHVVLLLIADGPRQRDFARGDGSIPKSGPGVLRVNCDPVRSTGGRLRVVSYLALQFDLRGSHRENQRL